VLSLDPIGTLAFAGVVLFLGHAILRLAPPLARVNVPAPVVGGLLVAAALTVARAAGQTPLVFDTALQRPLMIAFFTTIGFGASLSLLRVGGPAVIVFLGLSTAAAVLQNLLGGAVALALGQPPLLGVLAGSVALTGGPATGLAFAPLFEEAGVSGAATLAVAAAMAGIVTGGLLGAPVGTYLIERRGLRPKGHPVPIATPDPAALLPEPDATAPAGEDVEAYSLLRALVALLVAMALGGWVSGWFEGRGLTLPAYVGAMLVAAAIRNLVDLSGRPLLSQRTLDDIGHVALALFLSLALMTLKLWELANLALPLAVLIVAQLLLVAALCPLVVRLSGRDYEAAVMTSGFIGFMLGTTANAMANMKSLAERYGPAPRAFLVVPIVGAFFIDFTNALIVTFFVDWWR
jgi:ESS family glutamate:Na+ symporter